MYCLGFHMPLGAIYCKAYTYYDEGCVQSSIC